LALKDGSYEKFWLQKEEDSQVKQMEWSRRVPSSLPSHPGLPS